MEKPLIELQDVIKRFGSRTILDGVNLAIYEGEVTTIIGKSGTGKSVLLKHIIGLLKPDEGRILYNDQDIGNMNKQGWDTYTDQISYMFQNNALFDSMTVFENVALPLKQTTKMNRKEIEEKLMSAKREADVASDAKSQFLANMTHEIRTPMNAVMGFADLLSMKINDDQQKNYVDAIVTSGKSLLALINDILDLSKVEAGKMELQFEYVDSRQIFNDLKHIFSKRIEEKNLKFIIELDEKLPPSIYVDEVRIRQILVNLISNGINFTDKGILQWPITQSSKEVRSF